MLIARIEVTILGASFDLLPSIYRSWIIGLPPEESRGRVVSLGESLGRVSSTAAPVVIGVLIGITAPAIGFGPMVRWMDVAIDMIGGINRTSTRSYPESIINEFTHLTEE